MRGRLGAGIAASLALVLCASIGATGASAATEVGNVCPANFASANATIVQLANVSSSLPIAVPSAGVATKWKVESQLTNKPQVLKVFRPTGVKHEFRIAGESTEQTVVAGQNAFDTRIPVQPGDQFGLYGANPSGALNCNAAVGAKPADVAGSTPMNFRSTDAPVLFGELNSIRVAVSAIVEPDADGDGFGDETQDKCPQSAAFQAECAQISLDQFAVVGRAAITVLVIADHEAPVTVTGTNRDQSGRAVKRRPKGGFIDLKGGTQTVVAGKIARFKLPFSSKLKSALRDLPRAKSLKLAVTASARNLVGQVSKKTTTVRLRGQE
jgi:hypothetical protein